MKPALIYRESLMDSEELAAAQQYFDCYRSVMELQHHGGPTVQRFSVLPFAKDQIRDIELAGAVPVNSYQQHRWIANLGNWTDPECPIAKYTPRTWTSADLSRLPDNMSFVLKGETNSRKFQFNTMMFAQDKRAAINVYSRLMEDSLISSQEIYIREYVPLKRLGMAPQGLPISKEFRVFCAFGEVLSSAFYWASNAADLDVTPDPAEIPKEFLATLNDYIKDYANFYVIDVAQTVNNDWIFVELNDGNMSGLSMNDPNMLYKNLAQVIDKYYNAS